MKISTKILFGWLAIVALYVLALVLFPHRETPLSSFLNRLIQSLLFVISLFIFLKEPQRKSRIIFLNFTACFFFSILSFGYDFVGEAFFKDKYASHIFFQYTAIGYVFLLSVAIVYLVTDLLFQQFKIYQKYLATMVLVLAFFVYYFYPMLKDPLYLYSTEDIKQYKTLSSFVDNEREVPSATELASKVRLQNWSNGQPVGDLYPRENIKRIEELAPYLEGENYMVLLWKPLFLDTIYMNVLMIGSIILFFGYQYKKDPPQGAYVDKIMFLFLLICSMEIVHNWGFIKSIEWNSFGEIFRIGQYVTILIELLMVLFFSLRLRFITSVQGEFYEAELATNPQQISRWRDWVDEIVLAKFFNFKIFNGRLFQNPSGK
jgi:hypothetical protein